MIKYVLLNKFEELTGWSVPAINKMISNGIWMEGELWIKAPTKRGRRLIDIEAYVSWCEQGYQSPSERKNKSPKPL